MLTVSQKFTIDRTSN